MTSAQDDAKEPSVVDWAEVFTTLISHTSMDYDSIPERTVPQIEAVMARLGKHVSLKLGMQVPGIPGVDDAPKKPREGSKAPKLSEIAAFCGDFTGAKQ